LFFDRISLTIVFVIWLELTSENHLLYYRLPILNPSNNSVLRIIVFCNHPQHKFRWMNTSVRRRILLRARRFSAYKEQQYFGKLPIFTKLFDIHNPS